MQIFTPHITQNPFAYSLNVRELNDAQKTSQGKWEHPLQGWGRGKPNSPRKILRFITRSCLSL